MKRRTGTLFHWRSWSRSRLWSEILVTHECEPNSDGILGHRENDDFENYIFEPRIKLSE